MFVLLLKLMLLALEGLPVLAAESALPVPANPARLPISAPPAGVLVVPRQGVVLSDCNVQISSCDKLAPISWVATHTNKSYHTITNTIVEETVLPTETVVVTEVKVTTVPTTTEGLCLDVMIYQKEEIQIITVAVNVTTTRRFLPITTVTTTSTSKVHGKVVEQCYVKNSKAIGHVTGLPVGDQQIVGDISAKAAPTDSASPSASRTNSVANERVHLTQAADEHAPHSTQSGDLEDRGRDDEKDLDDDEE